MNAAACLGERSLSTCDLPRSAWAHARDTGRRILRAGLVLLLCALAALAQANVGSIQNILGNAKIQKRSGQLASAITGDILYEGDTVIADKASNVQIRMSDGAVVWVRASSELRIEGYKSTEHGASKDESSLRLLSGSMRTVTGLIGKKNPDNYRLSTPNATIGVRGTEFDAVYVSGSNAAQFNADSGTYHRVYQGSTRLKAGQQEIAVAEGQAVFAGSASGNVPRRLQEIPDFLNLPANATRATGAPAVEAVAPSAAPAQEQIRISVRYGSSSSRSKENTVRLDNGKTVAVPAQQLMGAATLLVGSERVDSGKLTLAMTATRASARGASVQLQLGDLQSAGKPGAVGQYRLSLDLPVGTWKEVTSQGPWLAVDKARAGSATSFDMQKVYIMADEAR